MKKNLIPSLLTSEIAAFAMLILLFFLNTSRPYLLLIPFFGTGGGYFLFKLLMRKTKKIPFMIGFSILLGILIAASMICLISNR